MQLDKMIKRISFLPVVLFMLSACLSSCARSQNVVSNIQAFFIQRMPGNIPVDENGNSMFKGPDTLISVYLETSSRLVSWDTAFHANKVFLIHSSIIDKTPFEAGQLKNSDKKMMLAPANGRFLWKLDLQPIETGQIKPPAGQKTGNSLMINGKFKGKKIKQKVEKLVELETIPSV